MTERWKTSIVLIVLGFICAGVLAEVILRITGIAFPNFYILDEHTGGALRPGASGWWFKEGEAYVRINSDGLRDRERAKAKPPKTIRIAVLGDSFAEAMQVPMEKAFWAITEERFQECKALNGRYAEVINFGVSGYGTAQELIALRQRVWRYAPDIVLLAFFAGNDVRNNSRDLETSSMKPFFFLRDGNLALDDSFRQSPAFLNRDSVWANTFRWMADYSRVLQVVREAREILKKLSHARGEAQGENRMQRAEGPSRPVERQNLFHDPGLDTWVFLEPTVLPHKEAWEITERLIAQMAHEVNAQGAKFFVVSVTGGVEVHPDPAVRRLFMDHIGAKNLDYPHARIRALGENHAFAVLNLAPVFRQYAERHKRFLHGFDGEGRGHWNAEGHRLAGETIAPHLCRSITVQNG